MPELVAESEVAEIVHTVTGNGEAKILGYGTRKREKLGYLGDHLTLDVEVEVAGRRVDLTFFVKTYAVPAENQVDFVGETGMFVKEVTLYRDVLQKFREQPGGFDWCPKFYFSKHRVLVLEDLSPQKFEMKRDSSILDRPHLQLVLNAVSALHASSIAFEHREKSKLLDMFPSCFREFLYNENNTDEPSYMWKQRQVLDGIAAVDHLMKYTPEQKAIIKNYLPAVIDKIYALSKKSDRWQNVLVHGDLWNNNILFRYDGSRPVDCRLVDFQFSRYAPPMHDVMNLLHLTTDKAFRDEHEDGLIEAYYSSLGENLRRLGLDVDDFCPRGELLESAKAYRLLAVVQSFLSMHYLLGGRKAQDGPEMKSLTRDEVDTKLMKTRHEYVRGFFEDEVYAKRVGGILCEMIDEYILNDGKRTSMGIVL